MNVGFDRNRNNQSRISYKVGSNWQQTVFQGSLMMRPVFMAAVDPFIGIPEISADGGIMVVPNPVSSSFRVISGTDTPVRMEVLDGLGRVVLQRMVMGMEEVDGSGLRNGLYLLRVMNTDGGDLRVGRLIIQH